MNEYLSYELHKQVLPEVSPVMTMKLSSYYINYSTKISRRKTLQVACGKKTIRGLNIKKKRVVQKSFNVFPIKSGNIIFLRLCLVFHLMFLVLKHFLFLCRCRFLADRFVEGTCPFCNFEVQCRKVYLKPFVMVAVKVT